jgi:hypothetical protein
MPVTTRTWRGGENGCNHLFSFDILPANRCTYAYQEGVSLVPAGTAARRREVTGGVLGRRQRGKPGCALLGSADALMIAMPAPAECKLPNAPARSLETVSVLASGSGHLSTRVVSPERRAVERRNSTNSKACYPRSTRKCPSHYFGKP